MTVTDQKTASSIAATSFNPNELLDLAGVAENMRVADLGCGSNGALLFAAARRVGTHGRVYGVDIQRSALEAIASKRKIWPHDAPIELIWSNLEKVGAAGIPDGSVDAAFLCNVLNQSEHQDLILREAARLVRQGGALAIVDWTAFDVPYAPVVYHPVSADAIAAQAAQAGFELAGTCVPGVFHFGLLFNRL